jgi:hypothetical protein
MTTEAEGTKAELASIIETADLIARQGLSPGSDGPSVLAGLISQLATQTMRVLEGAGGPVEGPDSPPSPNETEAPSEEDRSPQDAPADPPHEI